MSNKSKAVVQNSPKVEIVSQNATVGIAAKLSNMLGCLGGCWNFYGPDSAGKVRLGVGWLILACLVSGYAWSLGLPFTRASWLMWIAFVPFFLATFRQGWSRGYLAGFIFGLAFHLASIKWIAVFGAAAHVLLSIEKAFVVGVLGAVLGWFTAKLFDIPGAARLESAESRVSEPADGQKASIRVRCASWLNGAAGRTWLAVVMVSSLWVLLEYAQTLFCFSLSWGMLAYTQSRHPVLLQLCSVFGAWGIAWLIVWINAVITACLIAGCEKRWSNSGWSGLITASALLLLVSLGGGSWRLANPPPACGPSTTWAVAQLAVPQSDKFDPRLAPRIAANMGQMTKKAADQGADIVVWPETSVPFRHFFASQKHRFFLPILHGNSRTWMLLGTIEPAENKATYNVMTSINPDGRIVERYIKHRLVPFGEYLPGREYLGGIEGFDLVMNYMPGPGSHCLQVPNGKAGLLICFESMFGDDAREQVLKGANFLVVPTNDAWFKQSALLPGHFDMAVVRCAELARPLAQAANTGISGFISATGEVLQESAIDESTVLLEKLAPVNVMTLYARWGDWFVAVCLGLAALCAGLVQWLRRQR